MRVLGERKRQDMEHDGRVNVSRTYPDLYLPQIVMGSEVKIAKTIASGGVSPVVGPPHQPGGEGDG